MIPRWSASRCPRSTRRQMRPPASPRPTRRWPARRSPISASAACAGGRCWSSALAGAALLGAGAWFARLVSAALLRDDWLGWTTLALLAARRPRRGHAAAARDRRLLAPRPPASLEDRRHRRPARPRPAARAQGRAPPRRPLRRPAVAGARRTPLPPVHPRRARSGRVAGAGRSRHRRRARYRGARPHHPVGQARRHRHGHVADGVHLGRLRGCRERAPAARPRRLCTAAGPACSARCALPAWCSATSSPPAASR